MKRVIIVQARMTSTRLPGKVLVDLAGRPMLAQQIARLRHCKRADAIAIATTTNDTDDPVEALARAEGLACFRGDEHDVLSRYLGAASAVGADVVVRVTADCPLIDPAVVDRVIGVLVDGRCDYASNVQRRTYPRGLDVEATWADVLVRLERLATSTPAREHVTWFIHSERPELFVRRSVEHDGVDGSDLRWTVDTSEDLALVRALYDELGLAATPDRAWTDVASFVRGRPDLLALNEDVRQKAH